MINQLFTMPPNDAPAPESPRRGESNWAVIGGFVIAALLIVGSIGALVWAGLLNHASPADASGPQYLTATVGQSITISSVKVTLTSTNVLVGEQTPTYEQVTPSLGSLDKWRRESRSRSASRIRPLASRAFRWNTGNSSMALAIPTRSSQ